MKFTLTSLWTHKLNCQGVLFRKQNKNNYTDQLFNSNDKDNLQVQFEIHVGMATFYVHTQDNILQLESVYTPPTNG